MSHSTYEAKVSQGLVWQLTRVGIGRFDEMPVTEEMSRRRLPAEARSFLTRPGIINTHSTKNV